MTSVSGDPDNLQPFKSCLQLKDDLFESNGPDLKPVIRVFREWLNQVYNWGVIINMVGGDANGAFRRGCTEIV